MTDDQVHEGLDARTQQAVDAIRSVPDYVLEDLEKDIGRFVLYDVVTFAEELRPLRERDRRAALCVLIGQVRSSLIDVKIACEAMAECRTS